MHAPFISIAFVNPKAGTGPRERAKGVGPRGKKGKGKGKGRQDWVSGVAPGVAPDPTPESHPGLPNFSFV